MADTRQKELWLSASKRLQGVRLPKKAGGPGVTVLELKYSDSTNRPHFWVNYEPAPHRHSFWELHLLTDGTQTYKISGVSYPVEKGHLLLIPPYMLHAIPSCTATISKFSVCFSRGGGSPEYDWIWTALDRDTPLFLSDAQMCTTLFETMLDIAAAGRRGWEDNVRHLLTVLLTLLAQESDAPSKAEQVILKREDGFRTGFLEQFIRDNMDTLLSVETLAEYMHISTRQLNRDTRRERGMSAKELTESIKYEEACRLLSQTQDTVVRIAEMLGYPDESAFSRFFKRIAGCPPGHWRQTHAGNESPAQEYPEYSE